MAPAIRRQYGTLGATGRGLRSHVLANPQDPFLSINLKCCRIPFNGDHAHPLIGPRSHSHNARCSAIDRQQYFPGKEAGQTHISRLHETCKKAQYNKAEQIDPITGGSLGRLFDH